MRQLIVTADDVGLDRGMTEGAIRAHREGIVTACSIVAAGREFEDAVQRLRDVPSLEVGVHLSLVEESSLTGIALPRKYTSFLPAYLGRSITTAQIERELRAQIERVVASGLRVTHLNGHQHLHVLPRVFALVCRLAREFGVRYVRSIDDRGGTGGMGRRLSIGALSSISRWSRSRFPPPATNQRSIGVAQAGQLDVPSLVSLLDHVEGATELVTHPGVGVGGYAHWRYGWDEETRTLCAGEVRRALDERRIELIAPSRL